MAVDSHSNGQQVFSVGKIGRINEIGEDQVQDIAERRGMAEADVARMLAPNLG